MCRGPALRCPGKLRDGITDRVRLALANFPAPLLLDERAFARGSRFQFDLIRADFRGSGLKSPNQELKGLGVFQKTIHLGRAAVFDDAGLPDVFRKFTHRV